MAAAVLRHREARTTLVRVIAEVATISSRDRATTTTPSPTKVPVPRQVHRHRVQLASVVNRDQLEVQLLITEMHNSSHSVAQDQDRSHSVHLAQARQDSEVNRVAQMVLASHSNRARNRSVHRVQVHQASDHQAAQVSAVHRRAASSKDNRSQLISLEVQPVATA
jgi:hypothetical protein